MKNDRVIRSSTRGGVTAALAVATAGLIAGSAAGQLATDVVTPHSEGVMPPPDYRLPDFPIPISGHNFGLIPAADNIVNLQCPNGGFNWPYGGCGSTFFNITAPITMGLLQAYQATGNAAYLQAAIDGANHDLNDTWSYGGLRFSSFDPVWLVMLSDLSGDSTWADIAQDDFFERLSLGTYGDAPGSCGGTDYFPGDTNDYIERHKCARSGSSINLRAWDMQYMPYVAGKIGFVGQQDAFINNSILDALNSLDENQVWVELGLAGGVHALALVNHSNFPEINAPNYALIDGIDNLCDLADALAGEQNVDGSWVGSAQFTAFAVLALQAAQDAGCGPYNQAIEDGVALLWSLQDTSDGAFWSSVAMTSKNIQVQGDVVMAVAGASKVTLNSSTCVTDGALVVTIDKSATPGIEVAGGQFFLEYNTSVLSNPVVLAGDAPYVAPFFVDIDTTAGTIDIGVGIAFGDDGTEDAATMAVITFDAAEVCTASNLLTFRPNFPPTRLTDGFGNEVLPDLIDLHDVTIDGTAPSITAPSAIVVNADAGFCSAMVDLFSTQTETFDTNPDLNEWIVDRYAPYCFESENFDSDDRLKHCINAADASGNAFYNTQGRKKDLAPSVWSMSVDLYVPAAWATSNRRMAGLWGEGHSASFAIIEFTSGTPGYESTSDDPAGAGSPEPRFRAWASGVGWVDMGLPSGFAYDEWHTLTISLIGSEYLYEVGDLSLSLPASGAQEIAWGFLQGYNTHTSYSSGVTYDIHWDNFTVQEMPAVVSDNCDPNPTITATRDDNMPLDAAYPVGTTTITWTATDACGNSSFDMQTVEVLGQSTMIVDISLDGSVAPGPFTRCIEFELTDADGNVVMPVAETLTFINGYATATIDVPCGVYGTCLMARGQLHTLRSTGDLTIIGTDYAADGFDPLIGGDLNDDGLVDILDFGVFVWQFNANYGTGDTDCTTPFPNADMTGDGIVGLGDFSFIQINFLGLDEICPVTVMANQFRRWNEANKRPAQARTRISVRELHAMGLGHLAVADLNEDAVVDATDIALFLMQQ